MGDRSYNSKFEYLKFEFQDSGVVTVYINRPEVLNACNEVLHKELSRVFRVLSEDPEVKVIVVTGVGRAFSAGGDLEMVENMCENFENTMEQFYDAKAIVEEILSCDKPIVSAINGVAIGAGLAVALLADISVIGENVKFSDGHVRFGVAAGDHAVLTWPLMCGMAKSKYYLLTGEFLTGKEAERIGLVSLAVVDELVLDKALEIADNLSKKSQLSLKFTKRALNHWFRVGWPVFESSLTYEMLNFMGPDAKEGIVALRERRDPNFIN